MSDFLPQLYRKSSKNEQNAGATFSMQYDKIEESARGVHAENEALRYLAKVLVKAYFKQKKYE